MYRVFGLRLGPNFEVRSGARKTFYLWLTAVKIHTLLAFTKAYLLPYGFSGTHLTAAFNSTNLRTDKHSKILEQGCFN